ncbi:hypothetical protein ABZ553_04210 [Streptomyces sparsogenes]|uniref:hypothetical protein n=1 Tax=Streptomyces sparsogenes TaxID=67365 RepID=UPI0033F0063E
MSRSAIEDTVRESLTGRGHDLEDDSPPAALFRQLTDKKWQARLLFGGSTGNGHLTFAEVPKKLFGDRVHAWVREIEWSGQVGDSSGLRVRWWTAAVSVTRSSLRSRTPGSRATAPAHRMADLAAWKRSW